ncbi:MAG: peptidoglycan-associated lipoprotein Pal, partial [Deltaproteobacteria bacterium]|nr:peptidoglycan-associated lipoprotein Pal [Deltaproteobacteria bacterium]
EEKIEERLLSEIRAFESNPIYFEFDKSDLTPDARATLRKLADWLRENPRFDVHIEGHCDERGSSGYNLALGESRARAARRYLQMLGIEANRISIVSYGEERPVDSGHSEEAWAKNRRDEFKLIRR